MKRRKMRIRLPINAGKSGGAMTTKKRRRLEKIAKEESKCD